jgi:hypothetical protein
MDTGIHQRLQELEDAYFDGAKYDVLCDRIVATAVAISRLKKHDPVREGAEIFAPLLWGGVSGSPIEPAVVQAALAGPDGGTYLRSWSSVGRGLVAYEIAA